MESLVSMGADSVMTGVDAVNGGDTTQRKTSVGTPQPRSPLQSTSSLELSPRMEQVIKGSKVDKVHIFLIFFQQCCLSMVIIPCWAQLYLCSPYTYYNS